MRALILPCLRPLRIPGGSGVSQPAVLSTWQSCCQCWGAEGGVLGHGLPRGPAKVQTLLGVRCGWVGGQHWKVHLPLARVHLPPLPLPFLGPCRVGINVFTRMPPQKKCLWQCGCPWDGDSTCPTA